MPLEEILALLVLVAIGCVIFGVDRLLHKDQRDLQARLRRYSARGFQMTDAEQRQAASALMTQMLARRIEASVADSTFAARTRVNIARANVRLTVGEFVILQVSCAIIIALFALLFSHTILVALVFAIGGWFVPSIWLSRRQADRLKAFNNQLADTITLMSNSLRSGLSLIQAIELISREGVPPVSEEFARVAREIGLGVGPQDALVHLVTRVASDDLDLVVTAILVQFEVGGNLSRILDSIAGTIRERVKLKGEIRTMSAQGKMAGYMLSGMPIAVGGLLMLIAPSYIGKLFSPGPWLALPVCGVLGIVAGSLVIQKMVNIEV